VRGKLSFIAMVRGSENETYLKLRNEYRLLSRKDEQIEAPLAAVQPAPEVLEEVSVPGRTSTTVEILRIVVASPGDVAKERKHVQDAVDEVNKTIAHRAGLHLDVWKWETDAAPGFHVDGPKGRIDESMKIDDADIVIAIFWRRFGTPVDDAGSGTEHELRKAYDAWKKNKRPEIWVYFCVDRFSPTKVELQDGLKIHALKEAFDEALWQDFRRKDFSALIRRNLAHYINTRVQQT
jgi:hypothetical protein